MLLNHITILKCFKVGTKKNFIIHYNQDVDGKEVSQEEEEVGIVISLPFIIRSQWY